MSVTVKAGQVWADNDRRSQGRTLRVLDVIDDRAICEVLTPADKAVNKRVGHKASIKISRMRPTSAGYRLVVDVVSQA